MRNRTWFIIFASLLLIGGLSGGGLPGGGGGGGPGSDTTAIHTDTPAEITTITEKVSPIAADILVIEDSADSDNKKKVQIGNLPMGNVNGPASSVDGGVCRFDGTSGKLIQDTPGAIMTNLGFLTLTGISSGISSDGNAAGSERFGAASTAGANAVAVGNTAAASGAGSVCIGQAVTCNASDAIGIGMSVVADGANSIVIGDQSDAGGFVNVILLGEAITATAANQGEWGSAATPISMNVYGDATFNAGFSFEETSGPTLLTVAGIADGEVLTRSGTSIIGASMGTGNVVGPGSSTDEAICRYDSTTGELIQDSGITISDTDNVTMPALATFDGRDVSVDGAAQDTHIADLANPHATDIGNLASGTLAELNTAVTDATLIDTGDSRLSDDRDPTLHAFAGADHSSSTLASVNGKISDATLIDTGDSRLSDDRDPTLHAFAGADHSSSTLASVNGKISDATLIDTGDSRLSDDRTASGLRTATTVVAISSASAPVAGQVLAATSSTAAAWTTPSGSGDVIGPASATDLAICIYDGTSGKAIKNSTLTVSSGGSITIPATETFDGRDVSVDGTAQDNHIADLANPHATDVENLGSGTLAELNAAITDATLVDTGDSRFSDDRTASGLRSATTIVSISSATAPTAGQVLEAVNSTTATWQTPSGGSIEVDAQIVSSATEATVTSTTFEDINSMTITTSSTSSRKYTVDFNATMRASTANKTVTIIILEDGVAKTETERELKFGSGGAENIMSTIHITASIGTGKVIKVQWKVDSGTITAESRCLKIYGVN